jgi:hypothetical protein
MLDVGVHREGNRWGLMRELHAKGVRIPHIAGVAHAYSLGFWHIMPLASALLKKWTDRVDSVDGLVKVRGLFANN